MEKGNFYKTKIVKPDGHKSTNMHLNPTDRQNPYQIQCNRNIFRVTFNNHEHQHTLKFVKNKLRKPSNKIISPMHSSAK